METLTYTLFKGPKRVTLKEEDMTTDKIGRIFQTTLSVPWAGITKPFQRNVFLADLVGGKWTPQKTVAIRFHEQEASIPGILAKVQDAVGGGEELLILTDGQGNEILDTEGTKGSTYWKQNSRKVFAVPEQQFLEIRSKKRRVSQRDDDSQLPEVLERIEEVVLASQELPEVAQTIRRLSELKRMHFVLSFTAEERAAIKNAFACLICKGPMNDPVIAVCCHSLIACKACMDQWQQNANTCVKCRAANSRENTFRVTGIDGALSAFGDLIKD